MSSTLDNSSPKGLFALFKSEQGTGKSVGALSFPNPYVLDHDRKMPAIALKHFPGKEIHWDIFDDSIQIGNQLLKFLHEGCPYETIIGDTITSLSHTTLKTIDDCKGTNILTYMNTLRNGKNKNLEVRGFDHYNGETNFIKFYLDTLKALWARDGNPKHVLVLAHVLQWDSKDIKTGLVTTTRKIVTAGKDIAAYIPAQFDEVYHFYNKVEGLGDSTGVSKIVKTESTGEDFAKTAYHLPGEIDFTNKNLYDEICKYADFGFLRRRIE